MTPTVDLAAVARARGALADLVAAHPHLRSPNAQARLAASLLTLMEPHMPPRLAADSPDTTIVGVRMTPAMLAALDSLVAHQQGEHPDLPITRSTVLRGIVRRALEPATAQAPVDTPATAEEHHERHEREMDAHVARRILRARKLSVRAIGEGAGVSRSVAWKFMRGDSVSAESLAALERFASKLV